MEYSSYENCKERLLYRRKQLQEEMDKVDEALRLLSDNPELGNQAQMLHEAGALSVILSSDLELPIL